jgi:hypothetical protein
MKTKATNQRKGKLKNKVTLLTCRFSSDFAMTPSVLAVTRTMQSHPAGNQPNSGLAKSRPEDRTRVLGGSALGSGTRVARTNAGCVWSDAGVVRVEILQANVPLYGIACGSGLVLSLEANDSASSCHKVRTQNSISGLLAATESVVVSGP